MKFFVKSSVIILLLFTTAVFGEDEKKDKKDTTSACSQNGNKVRCVNSETKAFWGLTFTPSYKNIYELNLLSLEASCDDESKITGTPLPKKSYFRQSLDRASQTEKEIIIHVYEVEQDTDEATTEKKYFDQPFRVCLSGINEAPKSSYKRVGGVSTGLLVVPFKFRDGDIYSDSTIGQYISYKWEVIELLATAGLSQISVSEVGSDEVESKTGLTFALGVNFEIAENWDVAFVTGQDHLSGSDGDNWKYQDEWWVSFAIGFNFTR